jgi:hypothetical protein
MYIYYDNRCINNCCTVVYVCLVAYSKGQVRPKKSKRIYSGEGDYKSIVSHINEFNEYFLKFGIVVEESEVKLECLGELAKIEDGIQESARFNRLIKNDKISKSEISRFSWLEIWLGQAKSLHWLSDWLEYKKSLYYIYNRL